MIISHKYRFIFVKTLKTAGTSLEVFLSQVCGAEDVVTPIYPAEPGHVARNHHGFFNPLIDLSLGHEPRSRVLRVWLRRQRFRNHLPAQVIRSRVPRSIWDGYFKFCVERNPWDKTLSHYHMVRSRSGTDLSLDQYLEQGELCWNLPIYTDPRRGNVLVDRVLRYEHLDQELARVFEQLGVPFDGSLSPRAKSGYRQDRRPYQEVFTPAQGEAVRLAFADEIALHGYQFHVA